MYWDLPLIWWCLAENGQDMQTQFANILSSPIQKWKNRIVF